MFVIVEIMNKQYKVSIGDIIIVEKDNSMKLGDKAVYSSVCFVGDKNETFIGSPYLSNYKVVAEVIERFKNKKTISFKKRRRKNSRRTIGHRQQLMTLSINDIIKN